MRESEVNPILSTLHTKDLALLTWLDRIPEPDPFGLRYSNLDMLMEDSALRTLELTEESYKLRFPPT